ncbi:hypothetical protein Noda2021_03130 [Candidatus Dependentiae bacterium Noda2021]|nr:hypothetical protein Noda2021_03130 [Candidatus Dependentiae bacterium Noda2021]
MGGDLNDFKILLEQLERPEKLYFCLDTAHAYSYGYDISTDIEQERFIELVDKTMGLSQLALIHLNDTTEKKGSKIDRHAIPGKGNIGQESLKSFVNKKELAHLPLLLELPVLPLDEESAIVDIIKQW